MDSFHLKEEESMSSLQYQPIMETHLLHSLVHSCAPLNTFGHSIKSKYDESTVFDNIFKYANLENKVRLKA